jgi:hypothetical protein
MATIKTDKHEAIVLSSQSEKDLQKQFVELLNQSPIPDDELLANLGLYLSSKNLSRILFFYEIYQKVLNTHGVIMEFGVRWGQNLSLMTALRGIFEPFNRHRKVIGFDTFGAGFIGVTEQDGKAGRIKDGDFSVSEDYDIYLSNILQIQEALNPIGHLKKHSLEKGDGSKTIGEYLKRHPETLVSLAIFDFDIYQPTKAALEAIKPHLFKGSVLVFDELCDDIFPGETIALRETLGIENLRIQRMPMTARVSYAVIE